MVVECSVFLVHQYQCPGFDTVLTVLQDVTTRGNWVKGYWTFLCIIS